MIKFLYIYFILILSNSVFAQLHLQDYQKLKESVINHEIKSIKSESKIIKTKISKSLLNYYRLMLSQTPKNSVLVVNSYNDYFPLISLQQTENLNKTVLIVSLKLLDEVKYLTKIFSILSLNADFDKTNKVIYLNRIIEGSQKDVFISTTVAINTYSKYKTNYYNLGLIMGSNKINQQEKLEQFYKKIQATNLTQLTSYEKNIFSNYLPPLLTLYKIKITQGNQNNELKNLLYEISKLLNRQNTVIELIKTYEK